MRRLEGRRALVTGGGRGIGRAIAVALAREGAAVVITARSANELATTADHIRAFGEACHPIPADVSTVEGATHAIDAGQAQLGGLDILVNCAGIYGPIGPIEGTLPDAWWEAIRVNLFGTYLCVRGALPHLRRSQHGAVINMSGGGAATPLPNFTAYACAKAAVVRMTESLHLELAGAVAAYAIAPGAVNTRLLDEALAAGDRAGAEFARRARAQKESGGTSPERAASLAVFLATDEARPLSGRLVSAVWDPWEDWQEDPTQLSSLTDDTYMLRRLTPRTS